nr:hypothetical protein Iba_chr08dCG9160 [Ipomoea batatas]
MGKTLTHLSKALIPARPSFVHRRSQFAVRCQPLDCKTIWIRSFVHHQPLLLLLDYKSYMSMEMSLTRILWLAVTIGEILGMYGNQKSRQLHLRKHVKCPPRASPIEMLYNLYASLTACSNSSLLCLDSPLSLAVPPQYALDSVRPQP